MGYYVQLIIVKVDILEPVYVYRAERERRGKVIYDIACNLIPRLSFITYYTHTEITFMIHTCTVG